MPTSDEALAKKKSDLESLRQKVTDAQADLTAKQNEYNNDVVAGQLDAEAATLNAELARIREQAKAATIRSGAAAVLDPEGVAADQDQAKQEALVDGAISKPALPHQTTGKGGK